ncbi:transposase, putative [Chroococcus sp. FPU101]|nr:transposase, putative [Chroococcus sp. FPU101]
MSTARRIEQGKHQPNKGSPRPWRTRQDPFAEVWESELVPMLEKEPQLRPITLFEYLQEKYPNQYDQSKLRTLQKRVRDWKATFGPPKEVMFAQEHLPAEMGLSDFTHFKQATITIAGKPFDHLLYHYRLAYSGWQYVQIVQGGESFVALANGLQNALLKCGGSPKIHRTDSLSAAYRNINSQADEDLTQKYEQLCNHYQMQPTRNNRGLAHENGGIESSHGYFKRRLHQALLIRGSGDFGSIEDYQQFIDTVIEKLNRRCALKFQEEGQHLQPLPAHQTADYELLSVRVTCHSTITVRCVLYTVPSQLIGQRLTIHLYQNRLVGFLGNQRVMELARVYPSQKGDKRRAKSVDYRHVIHSLRRKPRAFLQSRWREEFLPNDQYRRIWKQLQEQFKPDEACRLMVESLYIAAVQDKEYVVGLWLEGQLRDKTLNLKSLKQKFASIPVARLEVSMVNQHPLGSYDQLLQYEPNKFSPANLTDSVEIPATSIYATTMAGDRNASHS